MEIILAGLFLIIWLNVGIIAERSLTDLNGGSELPYLSRPWRIVVILLAPIMFLICERHLFFSSRDRIAPIEDNFKIGD